MATIEDRGQQTDAAGVSLCDIEREYDEVFYRAGIANRALNVLDDAIKALQWQRRALKAEVESRNHDFAEFIVTHPEVKQITERRKARRQDTAAIPPGAGPAGRETEA